jgi:hypothetical protein
VVQGLAGIAQTIRQLEAVRPGPIGRSVGTWPHRAASGAHQIDGMELDFRVSDEDPEEPQAGAVAKT